MSGPQVPKGLHLRSEDTSIYMQEMRYSNEAGLGLKLAWPSVSVGGTVCLLRLSPNLIKLVIIF